MTPEQAATTRQILAHHSKSFALAGKLLPAWCRRDAAALYAWCRRCDDAVDVPDAAAPVAEVVDRLRAELDSIYAGQEQTDPVLGGMQDVVLRHKIPRRYPDDLVAGMAMDIGVARYRTFDELLLYCYRAAGTVGLMMARLMNVQELEALRRAVDLGIAMQLTNICRDVAEDERRGRVYLPEEFLGACQMPTSIPERAAMAVSEVLRRADDFYRSGDAGLVHLPLRCAVAIRAARLIYAEIGRVIARRRCDVLAGRAVVSRRRKLLLLAKAAIGTGARFALRTIVSGLTKPRSRIIPLPFDLPTGAGPGDSVASQPKGAGVVAAPRCKPSRAKMLSEDLQLGDLEREMKDSKVVSALGAPS